LQTDGRGIQSTGARGAGHARNRAQSRANAEDNVNWASNCTQRPRLLWAHIRRVVYLGSALLPIDRVPNDIALVLHREARS
jgi:hypothetical protein